MLAAPLAVAAVMVVLTVAVHLAGLTGLIAAMRWREDHIHGSDGVWRQMMLIMAVVLALFMLHAFQIWLYAMVYWSGLNAFSTFEEALYYSTVTFTTVGYGDVVLDGRWRMVGAVESANGFLLLGWSTAFLIQVVARLRAVEFKWLDRREAEAELFDAKRSKRRDDEP
jgi:hypothetical protein